MLALHAGAQESPKAPSSRLDETAAKRLQRLKEQADRSPGNKSYLYDYIQALEEAGLDTDVLAMRARLDPASTPSTVLARIGRAANNQKQFPVAVDYFEEALKKAPDSVDIIAGLSYALVDNNRAPDAQRLLEGKPGLLRNHVPLLDAYAESLRAQREDAHALLAYQRILELDPNNREAKRNEILTVGKLGAPNRAIELAELSPGLLGEEELASLRGGSFRRRGTLGNCDGSQRPESIRRHRCRACRERETSGQGLGQRAPSPAIRSRRVVARPLSHEGSRLAL